MLKACTLSGIVTCRKEGSPQCTKVQLKFPYRNCQPRKTTQSHLLNTKHFQNMVVKETRNLRTCWMQFHVWAKRILQILSIPSPLFPCCTDVSAFRGGAQVSNHLIRSPHLVAPPDKSPPHPLQSKLTGMCARNSEHARF